MLHRSSLFPRPRLVCALVSAALCLIVTVPRVARAQARQPPTAGAAPGAKPAAADGRGTVQGKVLDKNTGDPIIEAGVEVIQTGKRVRTDLDGKYSLELPAGTYELRIFAPLFVGTRLQNVVIKPNQVTVVDTALKPEAGAGVEVVEVVAEAKKAAESTQLLQRQASDVVEDNIGAQTISKSPDSNAGEIVTRLPAVTIKENKYVYVRGLSQRYSYGLLNKSRLPSTDPNVRVVPLDLFPATFIDALSVVKTYSADLPGDFSGGLVNITLEEFPDRLTYGGSFSLGFNTDSTFQDFLTYQGSSLDAFGFGTGYRALPGIIPTDPTTLNNTTGSVNRVYSSSLRNIWTPETVTAPPNYNLQFSAGNRWGPVGGGISVQYGTKWVLAPNEVDQVLQQPGSAGTITTRQSYTGPDAVYETNLAALGTLGYELSPNHRFTLRALVNRNSSDETTVQGGSDTQDAGLGSTATSLIYTADLLGFGQLSGAHRWSWISVDWRTALSQTTENSPDSRFYRYTYGQGEPPRLDLSNAPGRTATRTYTDLSEWFSDSAVDFSVPFKTALPFTDVWRGLAAKFNFGPAYAYRSRNVEYFQFVYDSVKTATQVNTRQPVEAILQPVNLGSLIQFSNAGQSCTSEDQGCQFFEASQEIAAFYGLFDLPILQDTLRLNAGVRPEYSYIGTKAVKEHILNDLNWLPGINLVWTPRTDMSVRAGFSQTVSRPDFRELDPTLYVSRPGDPPVQGNPTLTTGTVDSYDLRWDWFFSPYEIASVSLFYKSLSNPIEDVLNTKSSSTVKSFLNADTGYLYGTELEGRKNFGFVGPWLLKYDYLNAAAPYFANVNLNVNVSLIDSQVDFGTVPLRYDITNKTRQMQGQAPYTVNAALEYDFGDRGLGRLLYQTTGRSIAYAGVNGLGENYQEPRNSLDFVLLWRFTTLDVPLSAKFAVENMLNDRYLYTQDGFITQRYRNGVTFNIGLAYLFE